MTTNDIDAIRKRASVVRGRLAEDRWPGDVRVHNLTSDALALCDEIEQLRARLAATEPEELTEEPGPEVTRVIDDEGDLWVRSPEGWRFRTSNGDGDPWKWAGIAATYGPMRAVES